MDPMLAAMLLNAGGNMLSGLTQERGGTQAGLDLASRTADRNYGLAQNAQQMAVLNSINRAPMADKGQYLALNHAAPTAFQPRDYTQGLTKVQGAPQGGAQAQLAANQAAANNYKPGAGGVDTDTMKLIMGRLGVGGTPSSTNTTVNYGGQQYSPDQWKAYLAQHPELAGKGY